MRWIEFEGKTPVNTPADPDIPDWKPWSEEQWNSWLKTSDEYFDELERLDTAGDVKGRNQFIDDHSAHWGQLKAWLKALSKGKCWFSEVKELYSHYDVEHFRPKKEAKNQDKSIRDGYWWLSFDYTNYRLCGNVGNRKKGGWFPLHEGSACSSYQRQCEELDPTDEGDVSLIAFDEEGKAIPAPRSSEWERLRATETIERLKLNEHGDLAEARRKVWNKVLFEIGQYEKYKARCNQAGNPAAKQKMRTHCLNIKKLTSTEAELSSVAKWCIFFHEDAQLSSLVA